MKAAGLRQACGLVFNLLALLCILQNLWESSVVVVRYAWVPVALATFYVIVRGRRAFWLFLKSRDSEAACFLILAGVSFLSLFFARGPGAEFANMAQWGRAMGAVARVLRFHDMFGSWWFVGLASALFASLAAKLFSRRVWMPAGAGFSCARVGLLFLLVAGAVWKLDGKRGWIEIAEGDRTGTVRDADSLESFDLPFAVELDLADAETCIAMFEDDEPVTRDVPPVSRGGWRIQVTEHRRHGASLFVVRDPGWGLAGLGLGLVVVGLVFDAAAGGRKKWV